MRKIGIIGMGNVGAAVAHQLIASQIVDDLALYDINEAKVNADALDFQDALANLENHVNITVNDWSQLRDAQIIISTLGKISLTMESKSDRFAELRYTRKALGDITANIRNSGFNGVLVVVSNPVDVITALYQELTGLPTSHVLGTGTLLDSARMQRIVGEQLGVDPRSVSGYNLGEHGNSQFTAWSTVRVLNQPITELAKKNGWDLEHFAQLAREGGFAVASGKHYTNYGVAAAACRIVSCVFQDSHTVLPVSHYREDYGVYLSYPAIVGRDGIVATTELALTAEEKAKMESSAEFIKERVAGSRD